MAQNLSFTRRKRPVASLWARPTAAFSNGPRNRFSLAGVQRRQPAPAQQVTLGHTGVLSPLRAEVVAGAVGRGAPDQMRQRLGQAPPTLLTLPQPLLGLLPVGNVQLPPLDEAEGPV